MNKEKILSYIDAEIIMEDNEFTKLTDFINSHLESEGCPLCEKPEVLVHWQNMLKEYERFMMETKTEIAKRMWGEWHEKWKKDIRTLDFPEWLEDEED